MNNERDITNDFWEYVEQHRQDSKLSEKVYKWLDRDNLNEIIEYHNSFWWNLSCPSTNSMPKYIYDYIKSWGESRGLTYVFDI